MKKQLYRGHRFLERNSSNNYAHRGFTHSSMLKGIKSLILAHDTTDSITMLKKIKPQLPLTRGGRKIHDHCRLPANALNAPINNTSLHKDCSRDILRNAFIIR